MKNTTEMTELSEQEFAEVLGLAYILGQQRMEVFIAQMIAHVPPETASEGFANIIAEVTARGFENERNGDRLLHKYEGLISRLLDDPYSSQDIATNMPAPKGSN